MPITKWSSIIFFYILGSFSCLAQKAYQINTNNGLSSNNLTVIIKDRNNYMWMGSYDGVQKHEGSRVKIYRNTLVDSLSLSSNEAHTIFEDREGFIWAATMAGVDRIDPKTDVIRHYSLKSYFAHEGNGYPYAIFQDKKDSIWVSNDGGLFRINAKTGKYNQVEEKNTNGNGVYNSQTGYKGSFATETGIWIYTTAGMVFYEYSSEKFHSRYYNPQNKKIFDIEAGGKIGANGEICHDKKGNLYFIANDSILIKYNIQNEKTDSFPFAPPPLSWQCCYSLACDYEDNIWIGFRYGGILLFNQTELSFTPVRFEGVNSLIGSNYIYSLAEDYLHRMWATTDNGAYIIDKHATGIRQFFVSEKKDFRNKGYTTGKLTKDELGNLYMPFDAGSLIVFNQNTTNTKHFIAAKKNRPFPIIYPSYKGRSWVNCDGHFYAASLAKGKVEINTKVNLLTSLKVTPHGTIMWMLKAKNTLLICVDNSLFAIKEKMAPKQVLTNCDINRVCLSPDSQYLYYTNARSGISRFNIISQKEDTFSIMPLLEKVNFSYIDPKDIVYDGRGNIWLATQNGIIRYNIANKSIQIYTIADGLSNNFSFALCVDRNKNVWVATLGGISYYNTAKNNFSTVNYFSSSNYSDAFGSGLLLNNGNVAFYIVNRLILIDPDRLMQQHTFQKQLNVNEIAVNGKSADGNKKYFSLNYNENRLMIKFGLLDFENASKVNYWYNLDGSDSNWISLGNHAELFFYSLSPGTYNLKVKAVDGSGNPVPDTINLTFVINPPFYKTTWFFSLLILIAVTSLLRAYFVVRNKYRQQKILNVFVASLSTQTTVNDMADGITKNCVEELTFTNCAVYILNDEKKVLQKVAYKNADDMQADRETRAEIVLGKGAAGIVSQSGTAEISYIAKGKFADTGTLKSSEIIVPVVADGNIFGVIYSWSEKKFFYTKWHLHLLKEVARLSAVRISKYVAEERLRSAIARDLHDDLGSALSSINITSKIALQRVAQQTLVTDYLEKIRNNSGNMMESMSDIVWAIDPQNDTLEKVIVHMKEFAAEILEPLNINYHFFEETAFEGIKLELNKRKNLYLIFKESINNAAKYSGCTNLKIHIKNSDKSVLLIIEDNGKGFDDQKIKRGNGLRNMQKRAFAIGAAITIGSVQDAGTTVELKVPLT